MTHDVNFEVLGSSENKNCIEWTNRETEKLIELSESQERLRIQPFCVIIIYYNVSSYLTVMLPYLCGGTNA